MTCASSSTATSATATCTRPSCATAATRPMMQRVEKAAEAVLEAAVSLGGTLTGEHGIGIFKREHVPLGIDGQVLAWMAGVKALFDPNGIMNPGKKLPGPIHTLKIDDRGEEHDRGNPHPQARRVQEVVGRALEDQNGRAGALDHARIPRAVHPRGRLQHLLVALGGYLHRSPDRLRHLGHERLSMGRHDDGR